MVAFVGSLTTSSVSSQAFRDFLECWDTAVPSGFQAALSQPATKTARIVADSLKPVPAADMPMVAGSDNLKWVAWHARKAR